MVEVVYLVVYKALPIVPRICFHQKSSTLACVPEEIVMHSLYSQITSVNALLFPSVYLVFFDRCVFCYCVCYCSTLPLPFVIL